MAKDQDQRTDRQWKIVTLLAWGLMSALLSVRIGWLWGQFDVIVALIPGLFMAFVVVSLPFRVWQNVARPERRRARFWETVWCILAFLALAYLVDTAITTYPRDW